MMMKNAFGSSIIEAALNADPGLSQNDIDWCRNTNKSTTEEEVYDLTVYKDGQAYNGIARRRREEQPRTAVEIELQYE